MIPCLNFYLTKDQINTLAEKDWADELLFLDMGLKFSDADAADSDSPRFTIYEKDGNIIYRDSLPFTIENNKAGSSPPKGLNRLAVYYYC